MKATLALIVPIALAGYLARTEPLSAEAADLASPAPKPISVSSTAPIGDRAPLEGAVGSTNGADSNASQGNKAKGGPANSTLAQDQQGAAPKKDIQAPGASSETQGTKDQSANEKAPPPKSDTKSHEGPKQTGEPKDDKAGSKDAGSKNAGSKDAGLKDKGKTPPTDQKAPTQPLPPYCLSRIVGKTTATTQSSIKTNIEELTGRHTTYGGTIVIDSNLLPAGSVDVGIDHPFSAEVRYYAYLLTGAEKDYHAIALRQVRSWQAAPGDALVKKEKLSEGKTMVNLRIPDDLAFAWRRADLFIFSCKSTQEDPDKANPDLVSRTDVRVSHATWSGILAWAGVGIFYVLAAFALRKPGGGYFAFFDPIKMTAGIDGRASLGKLQILFFSLIVFGLILFFLFRTGLLSDVSSTVLTLLGIAGVGSTAAKGADIKRTTITTENKAYLLRKGWLTSSQITHANTASWREIFTTDGEFDVYRYQSLVFSIAVGGALLIAGVFQLSSFQIPETLLGILGLSQVVYIGGKVVTPTTMSELNDVIASMRDAEKKFTDAATAANGNVVPSTLAAAIALPASQPSYASYMRLATDARTLFASQTGIPVPVAAIEPTL